MARFKGLEKACVRGIVSRALPTRQACLRPMSFKLVSISVNTWRWSTELTLDDSLSLMLAWLQEVYVFLGFAMADDDDLSLAVTLAGSKLS